MVNQWRGGRGEDARDGEDFSVFSEVGMAQHKGKDWHYKNRCDPGSAQQRNAMREKCSSRNWRGPSVGEVRIPSHANVLFRPRKGDTVDTTLGFHWALADSINAKCETLLHFLQAREGTLITVGSLFSRQPASLLGIDISSSSIKLVELGRDASGTLVLERCCIEPLERGWIADGNIEKFDEVAEALRRLVKKSGTRSKNVAMALPPSAVITKRISL
ncbi:MAG: pilus assembly protein PilM, partial [Comamonas sp.]